MDFPLFEAAAYFLEQANLENSSDSRRPTTCRHVFPTHAVHKTQLSVSKLKARLTKRKEHGGGKASGRQRERGEVTIYVAGCFRDTPSCIRMEFRENGVSRAGLHGCVCILLFPGYMQLAERGMDFSFSVIFLLILGFSLRSSVYLSLYPILRL